MIELAVTTLRDELEQMGVLAASVSRKSFAPYETSMRINDHLIACKVCRLNVRGKDCAVRHWYLDGRRLGFNALMGALRDKGLA